MTADRLEEIIAGAPGGTRAERVHAAAFQLREASVYSRILLCELSHEAATCRHWRALRTAAGEPYTQEVEYLRAIWGMQYSRGSIAARKRLGAALQRYAPSQREWLRRQLVDLGLGRAFVLALPLGIAEDVAQCEHWLAMARKPNVTTQVLRRRVTAVFKDHIGHCGRTVPKPAARCETCGRIYRRRPAEVLLAPAGGRAYGPADETGGTRVNDEEPA